MNKKLLKKIGIDRSEIKGFLIKHIDFAKLKMHKNVFLEEKGDIEHRFKDRSSFVKLITEIKKKNKQNISVESETFYRGNSCMQIKIYDKKRHLRDIGICEINESYSSTNMKNGEKIMGNC